MKRKILCLCLMVGLLLSFGMTGSAKSFDDTDGHWAESSIEKWSEYEVINGKPQNKFDPNGFMTRAEASAVFSRLLVLEKRDSIEKFKDVDFNAWYTESLEKCVAAGILNGDGNNMNPDGHITREMFFVMIARALSIPTEEFSTTNFDDENDVSLWAEQYVNALVNKKYVNGVEDNRIAPKENITRASVITLLDRIIKNYVIEDGTYISNTENGIALVLADNCKVYSGFEGTIVIAKADITIDLIGANDADIIIKGDNITVKNAPLSTTVVVDSGVENIEVNGNQVESGISFTVKSLEKEKETKPAVSPSRPHSHNYIPTVTKNPTCTEDGVKTFKCSCGNSYTEPIEKLSENDTHTPKSAIKENETEGNCETKVTYDEVVYCSVCGEELSRTEKTGDFGDHLPKAAVKENETEGDCKTKITYDEVVYCSICNDELSRTEKTGSFGAHSPKSAVKENETAGNCKTKATYDEVVYCSLCDEELSRTQKSGNYGEHSPKSAVKENEKAGNCKTNATYDEVVYCSICNDELERTTKTGEFGDHSPKTAVKENETEGNCKTNATYDEVVYCSICNDELSRTEKTGDYGVHKYVSGKCEYCEERDPDAPITEPTIVVSNVTANAGDTVEVTVSVVNNPGIYSMEFKVAFDDTYLTLSGVRYNTEFGGSGMAPPLNNNFIVSWFNSAEVKDITKDGVFVTFTFSVSETAVSNTTTTISIVDNSQELYNSADNEVYMEIINGSILFK